jgi:hypothetical protein
MNQGIYTLANDVVYDQLVALLNSIQVNVGLDVPVCVIPYDERLEKVRTEVKNRQNVEILENQDIIARWEEFSTQMWKAHPSAMDLWRNRGIDGVYRLGMHRRFCVFDTESPFDQFIYFDGDVLVLNSLDYIFEQLNQNNFVVYDFQYKDPSHVYNIYSSKLPEIFPEERVRSEIFCAGCYASKKGIFSQQKRDWLVKQIQSGEGEILYSNAPDQSILNYMTMRLGISGYNFSLNLPPEQKTGNSVTSPHFEMKDHLLYDKGTRLTYLHYIGLPSNLFTRVCVGENIDFPYRDIFLYYRYLHEPEKCPQFTTKPKPYNPPPSLAKRVLRKLGFK